MVLDCRVSGEAERREEKVVKAESFIGRLVLSIGVLSKETSLGKGMMEEPGGSSRVYSAILPRPRFLSLAEAR